MSLRLAMKRSLIECLTESDAPPPIVKAERPGDDPALQLEPRANVVPIALRGRDVRCKIADHGRRRVVELPKIDKCIRNSDPSAIDEFGFVEVSQALPRDLVERILREAAGKVARRDGAPSAAGAVAAPAASKRGRGRVRRRPRPSAPDEVEVISNALQTDASDALLREARTAVEGCDAASRAMRAVFGGGSPSNPSNYVGYVLETPKVLITPPGSDPQLPHADDHCTSCVICLVHLRDGQEPTRVAEYEGAGKDYPTGITVDCDGCDREEQLPDADFRRGVQHTDEKWHCDCSSPHEPYDFEGKLTRSFAELLRDDAPSLCDAYAGGRDAVRAGDGLLGLPTLIHRGPGNPSSALGSRYVLFFTLRPLYGNMKRGGSGPAQHRYNPSLQIHASCILYNQFKRVNSIYERSGCLLEGCFGAIVGHETASLMREVKRLKAENGRLRDAAAKGPDGGSPREPYH